MHKLSYKTLFIIFFFLLISIVVLARFVLPNNKVKAAWWNETWMYRKSISITNSSGSAQTNTQIKILTNYDLSSLVTAGKLQSDLDDLRFTDINGNLIKYWIEDSTNNSVDIWGFIPSSLTSDTSIYMYYGNSSATAGKSITGTLELPGISCYAIKLSGVSTNGSYYIDPTAQETSDKFPTYCDMTANGGGWTLMMKANGSSTTFNYDANYWTTSNTLNPENTDITNNTEAKYNSFNILSINEIRATWPQTGHTMLNTVSLTTPLILFQTTVDLGPTMTQFDYTNFPYQTGYQRYGFNLTCASAKSVRWGWMFNNEVTCDSNDVTTGIGLKTSYSTTHGGWVGCCASAGKANGGYPLNVLIWGRESTVAVPANITFSSPSTEEFSPAPIAYWKFDEGTGTIAYDTTSNGNNGTINGTTWTPEDQCISGKCLDFSTINAYVNLGTKTALDSNRDFSISVWVKPTSILAGWNRIYFGQTNDVGFGYQDAGNGTAQLRLTKTNSVDANLSTNTISTNQWSYITVTFNNTTKIVSYYINGKFSNNVYFNYSFINSDKYIGYPTFGQGMIGYLDDVKIYPYSRTPAQILLDYNSRGSPKGSSANLGVQSNTAPNLSSKLIAYYKFDENNGTTAYDSAGSNNGIFSTGSSSPTWYQGKIGIGLSFNGNDYLTIPRSIQDDFSITFWAKTTSSGGTSQWYQGKGLVDGEVSGVSNDFGTALVGNKFSFGIGNPDTTIISNKIINDGIWHYLVATRNKSNGQIKIYVDGVIDTTGTGNTNSLTSPSNIKIGSLQTLVTGTFFDGLIDEVKIYNTALTAEEVKMDYNQGSSVVFGTSNQTIGGTTTSLEYCIPGDTSPCSPPVAEWKMDEGVGTSIIDTSGNNNNAFFENSPSWTQGKIGSAIQLNGSTQRGNAGNNISPSNITIQAWLYRTSNNVNQGIVRKDPIYALSLYNNTIQIAPGNNWAFYDSGLSLPLNTWTHIVFNYDGTTLKVYKNGQLGWSTGLVGSLPSNTNPTYIGYDANGWWLGGKIDHVKIYNYARTPAQIAYDYNKGSPIGWWKFDECQGNIAYDWSGIGNTGVIIIGASGTQNSLGTCQIGTSAAWTNGASGKINSSLNFDGNDDYVILPNDVGLGTQEFTASIWVKQKSYSQSGSSRPYISDWNTWNSGAQKGFILRSYDTQQSPSFWLADGVNYYEIHSSKNIPLNTWTNVVGVFKTNSIYKLYMNGIEVASGSAPAQYVKENTTPIYLGYGGINEGYMDGQLDDARIYNYALTAEQIKTLYNGGAVNFN